MGRVGQLKDFSSLFDERILERSRGYRDAGMVTSVAQSADDGDLWHARVAGTLGFYDVDIRIHRGMVISAACTCPYGQKHSYCKHVGAVLLTIADRQGERDRRSSGDTLPDDASKAVRWYWHSQFPGGVSGDAVDVLDEQDWDAVRRVLESGLGMSDAQSRLVSLIRSNGSYAKQQSCDGGNGGETVANMRLLVPLIRPTDITQLPHGWFTVLEAAYEHLSDRAGLRRLYRMYILMARTLPEAVYVQRLRSVSGEQWQEDCDAIVDFANRHPFEITYGGNNPAYERLLREEQLTQAAASYCYRGSDNHSWMYLLDLVAQADPERCKSWLNVMLLEPDSELYRMHSDDSARYVEAWIRRIETVFGEDFAGDLASRIISMFPRRDQLRARLEPYCNADDEAKETEAVNELADNPR
ncbi:SWIM zinc finger family protein [Bifidobacterium boum]|uniref:SWIM zinc finger family protein n=1 Tax=Bifidobacterium boum TaxID=78343 RepID=UPI003F91027A